MSLFDYIRFKVPLPGIGLCDEKFQQKDTSPPFYLKDYEVRADGTLWLEDYGIPGKWEPVKFNGVIEGWGHDGVFTATFLDGKLVGEINRK